MKGWPACSRAQSETKPHKSRLLGTRQRGTKTKPSPVSLHMFMSVKPDALGFRPDGVAMVPLAQNLPALKKTEGREKAGIT